MPFTFQLFYSRVNASSSHYYLVIQFPFRLFISRMSYHSHSWKLKYNFHSNLTIALYYTANVSHFRHSSWQNTFTSSLQSQSINYLQFKTASSVIAFSVILLTCASYCSLTIDLLCKPSVDSFLIPKWSHISALCWLLLFPLCLLTPLSEQNLAAETLEILLFENTIKSWKVIQ